LLFGAASLLAAPAIVRISSLMPVKAIEPWWDRVEVVLPSGSYYRKEFVAVFEEGYVRTRSPGGIILTPFETGPTWKEVWVRDDA
jgi:hypothetical protein